MTNMRTLLTGLLVLLLFSMIVLAHSPPFQKTEDGILVRAGDSFLELEVCSAEVIRVAFAKDRTFLARKSLVAGARRCEMTSWNATHSSREAVVTTTKIKVKVDLRTGSLGFFDVADRPIV